MKVGVLSVKDVVREIERRILNDFMDLLILSILHHNGGQISGYDVIKYLHRNFSFCPAPEPYIHISMPWKEKAC